jgi:hypothetical protein
MWLRIRNLRQTYTACCISRGAVLWPAERFQKPQVLSCIGFQIVKLIHIVGNFLVFVLKDVSDAACSAIVR